MFAKFVVLIFTVVVGVAIAESDLTFSIQNVADGTLLSNKHGSGQLCRPLSEVTTETVGRLALAQIWSVHYWGESPDFFGFHLINGNGDMSELTYDPAFPPFCYPVYNRWDFKNNTGVVSEDPILMYKREAGCLLSNGAGQKVGFAACDEKSASQYWKFTRI